MQVKELQDAQNKCSNIGLIVDRHECKLNNPCKNGGLCKSQQGNFTCDCNGTGYQGDHCDIDIDECNINPPCENEGVCINQPGKFTCECNNTGYEGDLCGIDIDECTADQPCENGVFCTNQTGSFVCKSKYMQYFTKNILSCTSGITKEFLSRDY